MCTVYESVVPLNLGVGALGLGQSQVQPMLFYDSAEFKLIGWAQISTILLNRVGLCLSFKRHDQSNVTSIKENTHSKHKGEYTF